MDLFFVAGQWDALSSIRACTEDCEANRHFVVGITQFFYMDHLSHHSEQGLFPKLGSKLCHSILHTHASLDLEVLTVCNIPPPIPSLHHVSPPACPLPRQTLIPPLITTLLASSTSPPSPPHLPSSTALLPTTRSPLLRATKLFPISEAQIYSPILCTSPTTTTS